MNIRETNVLLQFLAAIDRRTVDENTVGAWATLLEEVDPRDGMAGLKQLLRDNPDLLINPGHVLAASREARSARIRAEQFAVAARQDIWGNPLGSRDAIEAQRRYEQARQERWEVAPPPPVQVVPSPYREWEKRRREWAKRADSPLITDINRIEDMERERERALRVLRSMIEHEKREETERGAEAVETEEGV